MTGTLKINNKTFEILHDNIPDLVSDFYFYLSDEYELFDYNKNKSINNIITIHNFELKFTSKFTGQFYDTNELRQILRETEYQIKEGTIEKLNSDKKEYNRYKITIKIINSGSNSHYLI